MKIGQPAQKQKDPQQEDDFSKVAKATQVAATAYGMYDKATAPTPAPAAPAPTGTSDQTAAMQRKYESLRSNFSKKPDIYDRGD